MVLRRIADDVVFPQVHVQPVLFLSQWHALPEQRVQRFDHILIDVWLKDEVLFIICVAIALLRRTTHKAFLLFCCFSENKDKMFQLVVVQSMCN